MFVLLDSIVSCAVSIKHISDIYLIVAKPLSGDKGGRDGIACLVSIVMARRAITMLTRHAIP